LRDGLDGCLTPSSGSCARVENTSYSRPPDPDGLAWRAIGKCKKNFTFNYGE